MSSARRRQGKEIGSIDEIFELSIENSGNLTCTVSLPLCTAQRIMSLCFV